MAFRHLDFRRRRASGVNPFDSLMSTLLSGSSQLIAHPLEYGSMFQDRAGTTPVTEPGQLVGHVLDAGGGGYHATAISDAARGVYAVVPETGRRNLLTYTEEFDNAAWVKGVVTASGPRITANVGTGVAYALFSLFSDFAATLTLSYTFPPISGRHRYVWVGDRGIAPLPTATFDLDDVSVIGSTSAATPNISLLADGSVKCSITYTRSAVGTSSPQFALAGATHTTDRPSLTWAGGEFLEAKAQFETSSTATAYQKVVTEFDVTEEGVPSLPYLAYNGVNTAYSTPALPAPLVDKAQVFAGVRKLGDAAVVLLMEMSPSFASNSGSFYISAPDTVGGARSYSFNGRGSASPSASAASSVTGAAAPDTAVLTATGDISGDSNVLRRNGVAFPAGTADQGTGNYNPSGTYPLYYGAREGTSLFFNGRAYATLGPITRFSAANTTTAQIEAAEAYYTARVI